MVGLVQLGGLVVGFLTGKSLTLRRGFSNGQVSTSPSDSLSYDLNRFIKDSDTISYGIANSRCLIVLFTRFEIWSGGDGLKLKPFCTQSN